MKGKMPLKMVMILIVAVAVNLVIIEGIKVMLLFDHEDSLNPAFLASIDSRYQDYTLVDSYVDKDESYIPGDNYYSFHLLENAGGERLLAVMEHHFILPRTRYRADLSTTVPTFASNQNPLFAESSGQMGYTCILASDGTIESAHSYGESNMSIYLLLIPLLIVEYIGFIFLFRREEIT